MPQSPPRPAPLSSLSLWQAFVLMLRVFPTEQTQLVWGAWNTVYGLTVAWPGSRVLALSPHAYAWTGGISPHLLGLLFVVKGLPHVLGVLACVSGAFGPAGRAPVWAQRLCFFASTLDLFISAAAATGFLCALGPGNAFWLFYAFQSALYFWVSWRFWADGEIGADGKTGRAKS